MRRADAAADAANSKGIMRISVLLTLIVGASYAIIVFLSAYVAQDVMRNFVENLWPWVAHGFEIAGGILPAVGFGMLLNVMMKGYYVPYLIVGFLMASFLPFDNLLPVALVGLALALIVFNIDKDRDDALKKVSAGNSNTRGDMEDGI